MTIRETAGAGVVGGASVVVASRGEEGTFSWFTTMDLGSEFRVGEVRHLLIDLGERGGLAGLALEGGDIYKASVLTGETLITDVKSAQEIHNEALRRFEGAVKTLEDIVRVLA